MKRYNLIIIIALLVLAMNLPTVRSPQVTPMQDNTLLLDTTSVVVAHFSEDLNPRKQLQQGAGKQPFFKGQSSSPSFKRRKAMPSITFQKAPPTRPFGI